MKSLALLLLAAMAVALPPPASACHVPGVAPSVETRDGTLRAGAYCLDGEHEEQSGGATYAWAYTTAGAFVEVNHPFAGGFVGAGVLLWEESYAGPDGTWAARGAGAPALVVLVGPTGAIVHTLDVGREEGEGTDANGAFEDEWTGARHEYWTDSGSEATTYAGAYEARGAGATCEIVLGPAGSVVFEPHVCALA